MNQTSGSERKVTIIGAGVVGMACAVHLQRDGHQVTVIDRDDAGQGCSFGNAALLVPTYCVPLSMPGTFWNVPGWLLDPLSPLSIRWRDMPALAPWFLRFMLAGSLSNSQASSKALRALHENCVTDFQSLFGSMGAGHLINNRGLIYAYESEKNFVKASADWQIIRAHGGVVEVLEAGQIQEMAPGISPACRKAAFMPEAAQVTSPLRVVETLADEFRSNGGTILKHEVRDIEIGPEGPARLICEGETLDLDVLVVAAGALSAKFCKALGSPVPLVGERGYHVTLPNSGLQLPCPVMSGDYKFAITSVEAGLRAAGTAEFADLNASPNYPRAQVLLKHLKRIFPGVNDEGYSEWMGRRPSLPDTLPVIGRSPHFKQAYFAFGHGHAGLMGSVITGRSIADLVCGRTPALDLAPYRVDRF